MGLELKVEQKQRVYQKQIEQARILQMNAQEIAVIFCFLDMNLPPRYLSCF